MLGEVAGRTQAI